MIKDDSRFIWFITKINFFFKDFSILNCDHKTENMVKLITTLFRLSV